MLSSLIFGPLVASLLIGVLPRKWNLSQWISFTAMIILFIGSLWVFIQFPAGSPDYHWIERVSWIPAYGIDYQIGLDGISLVLFVLTSFLGVLTIASVLRHSKYVSKEFHIAFLMLMTAMLGTFASLDVFLFYVFWEAMLIPMFYLIVRFGGERRKYAALKFFVYTMAGSLFLLLGILWLYFLQKDLTGVGTTSLLALLNIEIDAGLQTTLFALFAIAFLIKIPVFPFHTWLPDAHVEAPTPGSIILAGVLLKMGGFGLIRFAIPLFPKAAIFFAPWLASLGLIGIIYGAYVAWAQSDMKKLVAYSSVSHMGFVVLGLFSFKLVGMTGAVFQMVAHGVSTGALFLLIGILYEKTHTRNIHDYGGIASVMPRYATLFLVMTMASIGLPGLCGFVGEFLILSGAFGSHLLPYSEVLVALSTIGIILGAAYMLSMYDRVFFGKLVFEKNKALKDICTWDLMVMMCPVILAIVLGIWPNLILDKIEAPIEKIEWILKK